MDSKEEKNNFEEALECNVKMVKMSLYARILVYLFIFLISYNDFI